MVAENLPVEVDADGALKQTVWMLLMVSICLAGIGVYFTVFQQSQVKRAETRVERSFKQAYLEAVQVDKE